MPSSSMTWTALGATISAGTAPALDAWTLPSPKALARPSAIWLRHELPTHTKSRFKGGASLMVLSIIGNRRTGISCLRPIQIRKGNIDK